MSRNFLTISQACTKLGAYLNPSDNFITKAQLVATGKVDATRLDGYDDNQFVVDDDIILSVIDYPLTIAFSIGFDWDYYAVYAEWMYGLLLPFPVRIRSTEPVRVYHVPSGELFDEMYIDVTIEPNFYSSEFQEQQLHYPFVHEGEYRLEMPGRSKFIIEPNSHNGGQFGIEDILMFDFSTQDIIHFW